MHSPAWIMKMVVRSWYSHICLWYLTPIWTRVVDRLRGSRLDFCLILLAYVPFELVNHALLLFKSASVGKGFGLQPTPTSLLNLLNIYNHYAHRHQ